MLSLPLFPISLSLAIVIFRVLRGIVKNDNDKIRYPIIILRNPLSVFVKVVRLALHFEHVVLPSGSCAPQFVQNIATPPLLMF
jgi:hypothetical protein